MAKAETDSLAGIQYSGEAGSSMDCQDAVVRLIQHRDPITAARILTSGNRHCLLLTLGEADIVAVKSGFASGYGGTGPATLSYVLQLLEAHGVEITEVDVEGDVIDRLDRSGLTASDIRAVNAQKPIRPSRWFDYVSEGDAHRKRQGTIWAEFPPVIPFAIVDHRIADLALTFWDEPDARLLTGYRRLEDVVRKRTRIDQHGSRLFTEAFISPNSPLTWPRSNEGEVKGRANLLIAAYMAFRNRRAHREVKDYAHKHLIEFLLLNHLYLLEAEAKKRRRPSGGRPRIKERKR